MSPYGHEPHAALGSVADLGAGEALVTTEAVGTTTTFFIASVFSSCHWVACFARSSSTLAASTLALYAASSYCERLKPPDG
jgi:hypothetical protein